MKKTIFTLMTIALISLTMFGCKKKDTAAGGWSATISANNGAATSISGTYVIGAETLNTLGIDLFPSSATSSVGGITFSVTNAASANYALNDTSSVVLTYTSASETYTTTNFNSSYVAPGSLNLTVGSSTVNGTFNCTAYAVSGDSVVITKGTFNGSLTK